MIESKQTENGIDSTSKSNDFPSGIEHRILTRNNYNDNLSYEKSRSHHELSDGNIHNPFLDMSEQFLQRSLSESRSPPNVFKSFKVGNISIF